MLRIWADCINRCHSQPGFVLSSCLHFSFSFVQRFCKQVDYYHGSSSSWPYLGLDMSTFASAGVFHKAGIKVPFFAFLRRLGLRPREAPPHMLIAMAVSAVLCVFLGCNPKWLYSLLPNGAMGYHPYDGTHVITQLEILLFSALTFTLLNLWGKYPKDIPSVNLDIDWLYRKIGRIFINFGSIF